MPDDDDPEEDPTDGKDAGDDDIFDPQDNTDWNDPLAPEDVDHDSIPDDEEEWDDDDEDE